MKRFCSMALVVLMIITILPMSVIAASIKDSLNEVNFTVIDNDQSTLAPGVTMNELVLYNSSNQRVEMYITTVDTTVDTVQVKANYLNNQNDTFGMQTLSDQVAAMEANYEEPFKIVAGINASYYNTTTGQPTGAFVMEGKDASAGGDSYAFFAVLKDGTYMIGAKGEYSTYKDQLQEAIGGYIHIVKDGAVVSGLNKTDLYPRQTLGLTEDGKLVLMTADGSQAPSTVGLTIQEQAEVMLALGCVEAIHLDGGNSATFGAIREGTDEFVTVNSPSGGAERSVSNTLMIISTAVPDGTFDHAVITSDYDYFVPESEYTFSAFGVDASNAAADIPETAYWTLSDDSFGTIDDGTFVSNGTLGDVDIQMSDDGEVIGSRTISIVDPTEITFIGSETTVPYGETAELMVNAMFGNSEAFCMADAFEWEISPEKAGSMDGFNFTATADESVSSAEVTAVYKFNDSVEETSITVKFGKGSEVLFDFEDGDISEWRGVDNISEWIDDFNAEHPNAKYPLYHPADYGNSALPQTSHVFLSDKTSGGQAKSGDYALGVKLDRLNADGVGSWIYNYLFYTGDTQVWRDVANGQSAVRIGMWVYMPQNATNTAFRICRTFTKDNTGKLYTNYDYMYSDYDDKKVSYNTDYGIPESGWIYVYYDLTAYDFQSSLQFSETESYAINNGKKVDGDYYPAFLQFINGDKNDTMEEVVIYIDDITLDFSDVTEDRDAPTISDISVCSDTANFVELNGQTVSSNLLSFSAKVSDASDNSNAVGLDYDTAKIYVDGIDVSDSRVFKAASGTISLNDINLVDGKHTIAFEICDKQGNETRVTKTLTIDGAAGNAIVSIVGHNDGDNTPKAGSVYYIDVKTSDAAQIDSIITTLKLNTANTFEYDNIICAEGVAVTASKDNIDNELTVELTNDGSLSGEAILASIPVRVWAWDEEATGITASKQFASGAIPVIDIECETVYGEIIYTEYDNYIGGFYSAIDVATELDNATAWHEHNAEYIADKDATCTTVGYSNRTYCYGCASVIDWGETVDALDHEWSINEDGKLACVHGGELFNGVYTNGMTYIDGVAVEDGWLEIDDELYYFVDGVKLTGSHWIDEEMFTFNENGVYLPDYIYDGWFEIDDTVMYFVNNTYVTGYMMQNHRPYYFDRSGRAFDGTYIINGETCWFDNGSFVSSENSSVVDAGWCGANLLSVEYMIYSDGTIRITGEGNMMNFADVHFVTWSNYVQEFITSIVIGKDITRIGNHAFRNCFAVTSLVFEEGSALTHIGLRAFRNMRHVENVDLPDTLQVIQWDAFGYTTALKNMYMPSTLSMIEEGAFTNTSAKLVMNVEEGSLAEIYAVDNKIQHTVREKFVKNGVYSEGGSMYYYIDNIRTNAGLVKVDGYYYYASSGGECKTGKYWVSRPNDLMPKGYYYFDTETGRMDIKNGVYAEDNGLYYYVDNIRTNAGLVKVDGYYYYASSGGECKTGKYWVSRPNDLMPKGYYYFDTETGRMDVKNGVYLEEDGLFYYVDGIRTNAGLVLVDGEYYYASSGGACKTGKYWVSRPNGYMPAGYYTFDETGKMIH